MGEAVTVPFYVDGVVRVTRTYFVWGGWRELTRKVAADLDKASSLQLRPEGIELGGEVGTLCVDTGSPNGSVVVHFYDYGDPSGSLLDMLMTPVRVTRAAWCELASAYRFDREECPSVNGHDPVPAVEGGAG